MALYHKATVTPTKVELIERWVGTQTWCPTETPEVSTVGAYRFDDPEGRVGLESHLVTVDETLLHVPFAYRDEPVPETEDALIATTEHSVLGTRWVYDGFRDERFIVMLAAVAMTGQGEALGMVQYDGEWFIAPSNVRLTGGGWTGGRVSVNGMVGDPAESEGATGATVVYRNDRFELTAYRRPAVGEQPRMGLTAKWEGGPGAVVLGEVRDLGEQ